jgi:hypothetical protein
VCRASFAWGVTDRAGWFSIVEMNGESRPEVRGFGSVDESRFVSKLDQGRERFLAAVVDDALSVGRRSPVDFLRHFGPREIMKALGDQPRLRANILVPTTGLNERVALKKPAETAGEDLEIALQEHVTTSDAIVRLFDPDDRVRYLDPVRLWAFVAEGEFWKLNDGHLPTIAREHIAFILERGRAEKLLVDRDIVDGIGLDVLVESLPKEDVVRLLDRALADGRSGRAFDDERVLDVLSPSQLVEHVSLAHIWERVVAPKLAFTSVPAPGPTADRLPESSPVAEVTVEEDESVVVEEESGDEITTHFDLEAMLSRVGPSDPPKTTDADGADKNNDARTAPPPPPDS